MSVFIKVERFASEPRFLRVRSPWGIVGEDPSGLLSLDRVKRKFFSIFSIRERYLLKIEAIDTALLCNGKACESGAQHWLNDGDVITCDDYTFSIALGSPSSEALALTDASTEQLEQLDISSKNYPRIEYSLAHLAQSFPLFPGLKFIVGSGIESAIHLPLGQIASRHCALINQASRIIVESIDGQISQNGHSISNLELSPSTPTFRLEPIGLEFKVIFVSAN